MTNTLREFMKDFVYENKEQLSEKIKEYYAYRGMVWTDDDRDVIISYGGDPEDYLCFTRKQERQIDDVLYDTRELLNELLKDQRDIDDIDEILHPLCSEVADVVADFLKRKGFAVYFPVHVEVNDTLGTEYISDLY